MTTRITDAEIGRHHRLSDAAGTAVHETILCSCSVSENEVRILSAIVVARHWLPNNSDVFSRVEERLSEPTTLSLDEALDVEAMLSTKPQVRVPPTCSGDLEKLLELSLRDADAESMARQFGLGSWVLLVSTAMVPGADPELCGYLVEKLRREVGSLDETSWTALQGLSRREMVSSCPILMHALRHRRFIECVQDLDKRTRYRVTERGLAAAMLRRRELREVAANG